MKNIKEGINVKWLGFASIGLVVLLAISLAYVTHGFLWSIDIPIYTKLLRSLPSPTGTLPGTDKIDFGPESPCGTRTYQVVGQSYTETRNFLVAELSRLEWDLVENNSLLDTGTRKKAKMLFTDRTKRWLVVTVESAHADDTSVILSVCTEDELPNIYDIYGSLMATETE